MAGTVLDRITRRLAVEGDCLVWTGAKSDVGYGQIRIGGRRGRSIYVHRLVFELAHGALTAEQQIDHLCRNRACARLDHLEAVTQAENIRRGEAPSAVFGRGRCQRGHDVSRADNVYVSPDGRRFCRPCAALRRAGAR